MKDNCKIESHDIRNHETNDDYAVLNKNESSPTTAWTDSLNNIAFISRRNLMSIGDWSSSWVIQRLLLVCCRRTIPLTTSLSDDITTATSSNEQDNLDTISYASFELPNDFNYDDDDDNALSFYNYIDHRNSRKEYRTTKSDDESCFDYRQPSCRFPSWDSTQSLSSLSSFENDLGWDEVEKAEELQDHGESEEDNYPEYYYGTPLCTPFHDDEEHDDNDQTFDYGNCSHTHEGSVKDCRNVKKLPQGGTYSSCHETYMDETSSNYDRTMIMYTNKEPYVTMGWTEDEDDEDDDDDIVSFAYDYPNDEIYCHDDIHHSHLCPYCK
jgi:hypothetical protein